MSRKRWIARLTPQWSSQYPRNRLRRRRHHHCRSRGSCKSSGMWRWLHKKDPASRGVGAIETGAPTVAVRTGGLMAAKLSTSIYGTCKEREITKWRGVISTVTGHILGSVNGEPTKTRNTKTDCLTPLAAPKSPVAAMSKRHDSYRLPVSPRAAHTAAACAANEELLNVGWKRSELSGKHQNAENKTVTV